MTPYLSFVAGGRNDDYGGNFLGRMQTFVQGVATLAAEHELDVELVVVDWNPPEDEKPLADAVEWPDAANLVVRVVTVPPAVHRRFPNADRMPIFEYVAKNVGIRRARGEFILATNPDLLYNEPLLRFFARRALENGRFYRVDRYDVVPPLPGGTYREKLAFCDRNFTKANVWGDTLVFDSPPRGPRRTPLGIRLAVRAHFREKPDGRDTCDPVRRLHTNASGDFFLMHRDHWHELRGYPELHTASHIDSYMCAIAASAGLGETVLPLRYRIYHQEHPRAVDFGNLAATTRPLTDYEEYATAARRMLETGKPERQNDDAWGLGGESLPTVEPVQSSKNSEM